MRKYRYGFAYALFAVLFASGLITYAQSADPSTQPLIQFGDLQFIGSFRLPREFAHGDSFTHGGLPITFNPGRNSLFVGNRRGTVAEVTVPSIVNSTDISKLSYATFLQGFYEPTEGAITQITGGDTFLSGLLVMGDRLYGNATIYYDANNVQRTSHYSRSKTLSTPGVIGMRQVWTDANTGFVDGYMATVPAEWQAKLGGPAITGQCCIPVAWRTSWGPSAFAFNPADINSYAKVAAQPLLYYSHAYPTLGPWEGNGPIYSAATQITGVAVLAGTRTALYFGRHGTGPFCYGAGTSDKSLLGSVTSDGAEYCYDPTDAAKGSHGYPYHYQIWAYDLNDLAAVKAGQKKPWEIKPYGVWPIALPFSAEQIRIGGVAYDPTRQIIYLAQMYADVDTYEYRPLIHALKVNGAPGAPAAPADTALLPAVEVTSGATPSPTITAMTLTASKTEPQPADSTITFTATPTGGIAPHQYKWLLHDGVRWIELQGWSTSNTFTWRPTLANSEYRIGVWARQAGKTADISEFTASMDFAIGNSLAWQAPYAPTKALTIAADKPAPQAAGSAITWTATPSGGQAPHQYKWMVHNGVQWNVVSEWSTSNKFLWTPAVPNSGYRIGAWVRSTGATADAADATTSADFAINGTATSTSTPTTSTPSTGTTSARLTAVALSASRTAPQPAGTTITFSAVPTGGATPHQYKWLVHNGVQWITMTGWSTSNTFNWVPGSANSGYRVGVWVRSATWTADSGEFTNSMDFPITAGTIGADSTTTTPPPTTTSPTPTPTTGGRLTAVSLTANKAAPQPANTTIAFTAIPTGGPAPHQYKFLLHNGIAWTAMTGWSTTNTFNWTPTAANSGYRIGVWVRSAGLTADTPEMSMSVDYPISAALAAPAPEPAPAPAPEPTSEPAPTTSTGRLTAVSITANKVAPQPANTTITFAATPSGGAAPHQYKWLIHNGVAWNAVTAWSTSNTYNWTPVATNSAYRIGVWVKTAGITADAPEMTASMDFPISGTAAPAPAPAPSPTPVINTSAQLTAVALGANKIAPQMVGTMITFTAVPNGGAAPHSYKWLVHNGVAWSPVTDWTTSNTFNWVPPVGNSSYRIGVWVRAAGKTADVADATMSMDFPILK